MNTELVRYSDPQCTYFSLNSLLWIIFPSQVFCFHTMECKCVCQMRRSKVLELENGSMRVWALEILDHLLLYSIVQKGIKPKEANGDYCLYLFCTCFCTVTSTCAATCLHCRVNLFITISESFDNLVRVSLRVVWLVSRMDSDSLSKLNY